MLYQLAQLLPATPAPAAWMLDDLPVPSAQRLDQWLDALAALPMTEWTRIGDRCLDGDWALATSRARSHIERAIEMHQLHVSAWIVRDLVQTAVFDVRHQTLRAPRSIQRRTAVAVAAAEWAALAIAMEAWLDSPRRRDGLRAVRTHRRHVGEFKRLVMVAAQSLPS